MVPMGPPLVWVPVAIALYLKGEMGYAIFLALWGTFAVSSVDNFLKPMLISQGTPLPMALVFLGVFGGLLSFGFLGILLGPIFLSLGSALFTAWLAQPERPNSSQTKTKTRKILSPQNLIEIGLFIESYEKLIPQIGCIDGLNLNCHL